MTCNAAVVVQLTSIRCFMVCRSSVADKSAPGRPPDPTPGEEIDRSMLGPSVMTLRHQFADLCAELGVPLYEARTHGVGSYASHRRPMV